VRHFALLAQHTQVQAQFKQASKVAGKYIGICATAREMLRSAGNWKAVDEVRAYLGGSRDALPGAESTAPVPKPVQPQAPAHGAEAALPEQESVNAFLRIVTDAQVLKGQLRFAGIRIMPDGEQEEYTLSIPTKTVLRAPGERYPGQVSMGMEWREGLAEWAGSFSLRIQEDAKPAPPPKQTVATAADILPGHGDIQGFEIYRSNMLRSCATCGQSAGGMAAREDMRFCRARGRLQSLTFVCDKWEERQAPVLTPVPAPIVHPVCRDCYHAKPAADPPTGWVWCDVHRANRTSGSHCQDYATVLR
jgi:hypothetical protein